MDKGVVREFRQALGRRHTFNPAENTYLWFGFLWGISFPLLLLISHLHLSDGLVSVAQLWAAFLHFDLAHLFIVFPPLFGVVFGALGTIRRDQHRKLARTFALLDTEVERGHRELLDTYTQTVFALSRTIEAKDPYTQGHCYRVWKYAERAAQRLALPADAMQELRFACYLHDIGKIRIPGRILNKPGPLDDEERQILQQHPVYSQRILQPVQRLRGVATLVRHHHERNDGSGYPDGLEEVDLPLAAKILVVADAMDAMRSDRPYRRALPIEQATQELRRCAGLSFTSDLIVGGDRAAKRFFTPQVVEALVDGLDEASIPELAGSLHDRRFDPLSLAGSRADDGARGGQVRPNCWQVMACGCQDETARSGNAPPCPAIAAEHLDGVNGGINAGRICWAVAAGHCGHRLAERGGSRVECSECLFFHRVREEEGLMTFQLLTPLARQELFGGELF